jgi:hypothetical protein
MGRLKKRERKIAELCLYKYARPVKLSLASGIAMNAYPSFC